MNNPLYTRNNQKFRLKSQMVRGHRSAGLESFRNYGLPAGVMHFFDSLVFPVDVGKFCTGYPLYFPYC